MRHPVRAWPGRAWRGGRSLTGAASRVPRGGLIRTGAASRGRGGACRSDGSLRSHGARLRAGAPPLLALSGHCRWGRARFGSARPATEAPLRARIRLHRSAPRGRSWARLVASAWQDRVAVARHRRESGCPGGGMADTAIRQVAGRKAVRVRFPPRAHQPPGGEVLTRLRGGAYPDSTWRVARWFHHHFEAGTSFPASSFQQPCAVPPAAARAAAPGSRAGCVGSRPQRARCVAATMPGALGRGGSAALAGRTARCARTAPGCAPARVRQVSLTNPERAAHRSSAIPCWRRRRARRILASAPSGETHGAP